MRLGILTFVIAFALLGLTSGCSKNDTSTNQNQTPGTTKDVKGRKDKVMPPLPKEIDAK